MERTLIDEYKQYYYNEMIQYNWKYCTAFPLVTYDTAWSLQYSKDFIYKNILSYIKKKIRVRNNNSELNTGIPFYAYYVICKQENDQHYHAHMIFNMQKQFENYVYRYIRDQTGNLTAKLETQDDVERMIRYMLRKGNWIIDADDEKLLPTGYNLNVKKDHFCSYK